MLSDVFYLSLDSLELRAERTIDSSLRTRPIAIISSTGATGTIVDEIIAIGRVLRLESIVLSACNSRESRLK
jgi:hypothetical protein